MASLRDRVVEGFLALLGGAQGWAIERRGAKNEAAQSDRVAICAVVAHQFESHVPVNQVQWLLELEIYAQLDPGEADPVLHDGNPFRTLDQGIAELEEQIPLGASGSAMNTLLGVPDGCMQDWRFLGWREVPPIQNGLGLISAVLRFEFHYRHDVQNPQAVGGLS